MNNQRRPMTATVTQVRPGGAVVRLPDGTEAWLPRYEFSYDEKDLEEFTSRCKEKDQFAVVYHGRELGGQRQVVSRRRAERDAWAAVDESWIGTVRSMKVTSVTRTHAYGDIEPGIVGVVDFATLDGFIHKFYSQGPWWEFRIVGVGDRLAGKVSRIDSQQELVKLDVPEFLKHLAEDPGAFVEHLAAARSVQTQEESHIIPGAPHRVTEITSVLVLDDDPDFLDPTTRALQADGYGVWPAATFAEASTLLPAQPFDAAIVDINLSRASGAKSSPDGIELAKNLAAEQAGCRIILITGEKGDDLPEKIRRAGDLRIADYVEKPITAVDLRSIMTRASTAPRKTLEEMFPEYREEMGRAISPGPRSATTLDSPDPIGKAVQDLAARCTGASVVLFEMDPLSYAVRIVARRRLPLDAFERWRHKLRYSPVRDVAIDQERIFEMDAKSEQRLPKHRWFLKLISYRSCIGLPVDVASPNAYCLFLLHRERSRFAKTDQGLAEACAATIAAAMESAQVKKGSEQEKKFAISGMSHTSLGHELTQVLSGADIDLDTVLRELPEGVPIDAGAAAQLRVRLARIAAQQRRAVHIAKTFWRLSKRREVTLVDVKECLKDAATAALPLAAECSAELFLEPCKEDVFVEGDETALEQVFFNLLLNAAQQIKAFIRDNGVIVGRTGAVARDEREWVQVLISDTGPGIHTKDFEAIFQPAYTTKADGSGMGLHICRTTVQECGGTIRVASSTLFAGTTFEVLLPIAHHGSTGK